MGVLEDLIAIWLATDSKIDLRVILIAGLVALPFAFISEIIVDMKHFPEKVKKFLKLEEKGFLKRFKL